MKRSLMIALVSVLLSGTAMAANPIDAQADAGGIDLSATLAPFNSFEWQAAPSFTQLAVKRRQATAALRKGAISIEQFESVLKQTDRIRSLLDQALEACGQNDRTGKCTKSTRTAQRLLDQANAELARLQ